MSDLAMSRRAVTRATKISKSNATGIANCRLHLRIGNYGAYARGMSGLHRAASTKQQSLIWDAIVADRMVAHFQRIHNGTCLIAINPAREDGGLVNLEMAA